MKIPENRHYYSLITENVDSMPKQNSGKGRFRGGVDHPPDQTGGKSASSSLGGIDAPASKSNYIFYIFGFVIIDSQLPKCTKHM